MVVAEAVTAPVRVMLVDWIIQLTPMYLMWFEM